MNVETLVHRCDKKKKKEIRITAICSKKSFSWNSNPSLTTNRIPNLIPHHQTMKCPYCNPLSLRSSFSGHLAGLERTIELNASTLHRLQVQMLWSIFWERPCRLLMWLQFWDWIVTYRVMRFIYLEIVVLLLVWEMEVSKLVAVPVISSRSSSTWIKDGFLLIVATPGIQAWGI